MNPTYEQQVAAWNEWNKMHRMDGPTDERIEQCAHAVIDCASRHSPKTILEIGCGTGWLSERLARIGKTTAIDLADEMIKRAQSRHPDIRFLAGDFMTMEFSESFDFIATVDAFSCVADHAGFAKKIAGLLKPKGYLALTTLNKFAFDRLDHGKKKIYRGQIRHWAAMGDVRRIFSPLFEIVELYSIVFGGHQGILRIINSPKLNRLIAGLFGEDRLNTWKGKLGFGQYIILVARKRA